MNRSLLRPGQRFSLRPACTLCKGLDYIPRSLLQRSNDKKLLRLTEAAIQRSHSMQWVVATAAFLASAVEFVEAFTLVLVVGVTVNWRSSLLGALAAAATLALLVATLGVALVQWVPIDALRTVIGTLLLLFGLKWLKNAILRYSGLKARHDEQAIYEETRAELRARGEVEASSPRFELFGFLLSYKSVLLEGLEVAFIVITFGLSAASSTFSRSSGIASAALGALAAGLLVILVGALVRVPLARVPENTLKFIVGIMLTTFGTFWLAEGFNYEWPLSDAFLLILVAVYLGAAFLLIAWLKRTKKRERMQAAENQPAPATVQSKEVTQ